MKELLKNNVDFRLSFDNKGFIQTEITRDETQNKVNNLLQLEKEYTILIALESKLSQFKDNIKGKIPSDDEEIELNALEKSLDFQKDRIEKLKSNITLN